MPDVHACMARSSIREQWRTTSSVIKLTGLERERIRLSMNKTTDAGTEPQERQHLQEKPLTGPYQLVGRLVAYAKI